MCSERVVEGGGEKESKDDVQACLPFDLAVSRAAVPRARAAKQDGERPLRHHLTTDALSSLGWPAGTDLVLAPCRTPRRGQIVLARDGKHLRIGIFEVQLGRAALRTDHGSVWLGRTAEFLGAVTLASAPLEGM